MPVGIEYYYPAWGMEYLPMEEARGNSPQELLQDYTGKPDRLMDLPYLQTLPFGGSAIGCQHEINMSMKKYLNENLMLC
jgi:hypothetical protein